MVAADKRRALVSAVYSAWEANPAPVMGKKFPGLEKTAYYQITLECAPGRYAGRKISRRILKTKEFSGAALMNCGLYDSQGAAGILRQWQIYGTEQYA